MYGSAAQDHFYTASTAGRDAAIAAGYVEEGSAGYINNTSVDGTSPFYQLYKSGDDHFYTTSTAERDAAVAAGYVSEGIAGYIN